MRDINVIRRKNSWRCGACAFLSVAILLMGCSPTVRPGGASLVGDTVRNSIGMVYRRIPAGKAWIGSPQSELLRADYCRFNLGWGGTPDRWEKRRQIFLGGAIYLGEREVTNGQYKLFDPSHVSKMVPQKDWPGGVGYNLSRAVVDKVPMAKVTGYEYPVNCITRDDANAFCMWLSNREAEKAAGRLYRLPTEEEWEYACRGGSGATYFWGNDPNCACAYANLADKSGDGLWISDYPVSCNDGFLGPSPVGMFKPNQFGLRDMLGNVWEICLGGVTMTNGEDGYNSDGVTGGPSVPVRGGSWGADCSEARCAARMPVSVATRSPFVGFRVVLIQAAPPPGNGPKSGENRGQIRNRE